MEDPKSIIDGWELSDSASFNPNTLLSTIMSKGMSFEPLWTDPRFFYMMCGEWWNRWSEVFGKWFYAKDFDYEPLWDRNGYETVHEDTADTGTVDTATSDREVVDRDTTDNKTIHEVVDDDTTYSKSGKNSSDTENTVSAYDKSTYQPHDKSETEESFSESGSGTDDKTTDTTVNDRGTEDVTTNRTGSVDTDTSNDKDFDRDYHSWGNWGISQTSQKLLKSEYEVRYWNVYSHMADIFIDEMTIGVY